MFPQKRRTALNHFDWKKNIFALTFGLIALCYLILFAALPAESIWISDEGNRIMSVQAYALTGSRTLPDPLEGISGIPDGIRAYPQPYFIHPGGKWRSAYQLFFPWMASHIYTAFGRPGVLAIAAVAGLLTILTTGLLARKLFSDDRKAAAVMGLCAFGTPVLFYSGTFLETTSAALFAALALLVFLTAMNREHHLPQMLLCGLLTGISILFREEGFVFAAGFGLAILCCYFSWKRLLAFGAGAAVMVLPLLIYNYLDSGSIFGMHSTVYSGLPKPAGNLLVNKLTDYSFYLFLLCLPFAKKLNLVLPWILLAGVFTGFLPKFRNAALAVLSAAVLLFCGASTYCNMATEHGGVFIYQSLLDHVPLFALCLLNGVWLFRQERRDIRFLAIVALTGIAVPPLLLNYDQPGMFWGGRHFLNIVPVLCLLSVFILSHLKSRLLKGLALGICLVSLAANLCGYAALSAKRNFSAQYVREIAKPEYQVILTDIFWMPEELAWLHRDKCILLLTGPDSLDQARVFLRANGIRKFHLLLAKRSRKITNESIRRTISETQFQPGPHYTSALLSFFEVQLFECSFVR